jgi:DGQHR domain-containing protein
MVVLTLRVADDALRKVFTPKPEKLEVGVLSFEMPDGATEKDKPGLVVDGQHRLLGMRDFSPDLHIPVVALLNPDGLETAFQFLVINNKSSKVPTDHIKSLALEYSTEGLEQRLRTARLSLNENYMHVGQVNSEEGSPFKDIIDWPANRTGTRIVVPTAIEQALQYIQDQNLKGLREADPLLEFFYAMWGAVKTKWHPLWKNDSKLLEKVGVICMTQFLTDSLAKLYEWEELDLTEPKDVRKRTTALLKNQSPEFWTRPWKSTSYDTRVGRQLIVDDLFHITRNMRAGDPWHTDLKVVDAS